MGNSFRPLLPTSKEPVLEAVAPAPEKRRWRGSGVVLVTDDQEQVRSTTRRMLGFLGFDAMRVAPGLAGFLEKPLPLDRLRDLLRAAVG